MSDFKFNAKCTKFDFGWGSAPDPAALGELTAPPDLAIDLRGLLLRAGRGMRGEGMEGLGPLGPGDPNPATQLLLSDRYVAITRYLHETIETKNR